MTHLDDHYTPAPGNEESLPDDLHTAHVRHDVEVWTDTQAVCSCSSFVLARRIATLLKATAIAIQGAHPS